MTTQDVLMESPLPEQLVECPCFEIRLKREPPWASGVCVMDGLSGTKACFWFRTPGPPQPPSPSVTRGEGQGGSPGSPVRGAARLASPGCQDGDLGAERSRCWVGGKAGAWVADSASWGGRWAQAEMAGHSPVLRRAPGLQALQGATPVPCGTVHLPGGCGGRDPQVPPGSDPSTGSRLLTVRPGQHRGWHDVGSVDRARVSPACKSPRRGEERGPGRVLR